jgi:hypothetical protein
MIESVYCQRGTQRAGRIGRSGDDEPSCHIDLLVDFPQARPCWQ